MIRLLILTLFLSINLYSQDPLNYYAPLNSKSYYSLKEASASKTPVYKLHLSGNLEKRDYIKLFQLTDLEALSLSGNSIDSLESGFGALHHLRYIEIHHPILYFPSDLANCPRLEAILCIDSKFSEVPSNLFYNPTFQKLSIHSNHDSLRVVIPHIKQNNLLSLTISHTAIDTLSIPKSMKEITIAKCYINGNESWFQDLDKAISLDLSYNQIENFEVFKSFTEVQYLYLNNNQLKHAPEFVAKLGNLKELDLRGNSIPQYEIDILKVLMPQCNIIVD